MKQFFKIILILSLLLYGIYFIVFPLILNSDSGKNFLINSIQKKANINIDLTNSKFKTGIIPSIIFQANQITVNKNLSIEKPYIKIKLLPLIFKTVYIKKISADSINANLIIDKNSNIDLRQNILLLINSSLKTKISNIDITNYNLNINDKIQKQKIILKGKNLYLNNKDLYANGIFIINNKKSEINIAIKLADENSLDNISLNGLINNLNLKELSPYIYNLSNGLIENISGIINLQAKSISKIISADLNLDNFYIKIKDIEKPIFLKEKLVINTDFQILNNNLTIKNLTAVSNGINILIGGTVYNILSKTPKINLNLALKDTFSGKILSLIPYIDIPKSDIDLKKLRKYGIYGIVNGAINISGNIPEPSIKGNFTAKNVYVYQPLNIPKATISLDFKGKKVFFKAFAPASKTQHVTVDGNVELYGNKIAEIDIKSTKEVNLKTAQLILNPLREILTFEIGPVPIMDIQGIGNINLKVKGNKEYPHLWGAFNFKNGIVKFNNVNTVLKDGSGRLDFQDENMHFKTHHATLNNIPIKIEGDCSTQGILKFDVITNNQSLNNAIKILNTSPMLNYLSEPTQIIKAASGKANIFITLTGKLKYIDQFELGKTIIPSGHIKLLNNGVLINPPKILVKNLSGDINFNNTDNAFNLSTIIDNQKINLIGKLNGNKLYLNHKFNNLVLNIKNSNIKIFSGELNFKGNNVKLNKIYTEIDSKPIFIDGEILNIDKKPNFDIYLNTVASQDFLDKFLNKYLIYPLIIKGNIDYSGRIKGNLKSVNINGTANMYKNSSIYYKGAIIEAKENPINFNIDTNISKTLLNIKKMQYNKLEENNKVTPLLSASGKIKLKNNITEFDNFNVKTQNPTDARIFNIIFKKPIIKEGLFTSNFTANGNIEKPSLFGTFNIFGINAPFLDSTIQDIDIVFKNHSTDIKMTGEILSNKISAKANIKNNLIPPYIINSADLYLGNFDVNSFLRHLDKIIIEDVDKSSSESLDSQNFNIRNLIIKKLNINAQSVYVRNLFATDVNAVISLINGIFSLEKLNFITAEGKISGKLKYNFINSNMDLALNFDEINANTISDALFDIKDQIYGNLSGNTNLSCNGKSHQECMKTLNGECKFSVIDGKMPKLGSLEYLLKSSNVFKSGITGLTINNLIQMLIPQLNSGEFESIKGHFIIKNGLTDNINIASKGRDLSIFIAGGYNFATSDANFEICGRLAKKISNKLGSVGNFSINTLFNLIPGVNLSKVNKAEIIQIINRIPGIELNTNDFRIFFVKFDGNLNTENYKQTFKWID